MSIDPPDPDFGFAKSDVGTQLLNRSHGLDGSADNLGRSIRDFTTLAKGRRLDAAMDRLDGARRELRESSTTAAVCAEAHTMMRDAAARYESAAPTLADVQAAAQAEERARQNMMAIRTGDSEVVYRTARKHTAALRAQRKDARDQLDVDDKRIASWLSSHGVPHTTDFNDLCPNQVKLRSPWEFSGDDLYRGDPKASDVKQSTIGDCYLVSTMGAIAKANPQWIKDRIHYDEKTGVFDVTLWDGSQWKHISVDQSDISTNIGKNGASRRDDGEPDSPLWPAVLESAYAKLKKPDLPLDRALSEEGIGTASSPSNAMEALTGNRGDSIVPERVWLTNRNIGQEITDAIGGNQPVIIETTTDGGPLVGHHAYMVEGITGTDSDSIVTLRNPWESNSNTPVETPGALIQVRLGDLIGSGLTGGFKNGALGTHPMGRVYIGRMGQ